MTLRTPRRRISPRAKRRYRVIRDFFRRALGSSSQQDIKINSSIAVNVTDLKHKIVGIEHQLNEVSKHCQDLTCLESTFRRAENVVGECRCRHEATLAQSLPGAGSSYTRVLYKPSDTCCRASDESDHVSSLPTKQMTPTVTRYRASDESDHVSSLPTKQMTPTVTRYRASDESDHVSSLPTKQMTPTVTRYRASDESDHVSSLPTKQMTPTVTRYRASDESDHVPSSPTKQMTPPINMNAENSCHYMRKERNKKSKLNNRIRVAYDLDPNLKQSQHGVDPCGYQTYLTSSRRSLPPPPCAVPTPAPVTASREPRRRHRDPAADPAIRDELAYKRHRERTKQNKSVSPHRHSNQKHDRSRREKGESPEIDRDFIDNIIKKQYRPMKMLGRKQSDMSQFSVPVCRDQEFSLHEDLREGAELCSCCVEDRPLRAPHPPRCNCRSMCDTRLYRSRRARSRPRHTHVDPYNDSTLYDIVPVKEKPSPKSRRKFVEDDIIGYEYYREVPPSPRTHRPRLNLKAQLQADNDEHLASKRGYRIGPVRYRKRLEYFNDYLESDVTSEVILSRNRREKTKLLKPMKVQTSAQIHQDSGTTSSLQYRQFAQEQALGNGNDSNLNKTQDTDISDKTDKALCEIKDILQSFLHEIKREASPSDKNEQQEATQRNEVSAKIGTATSMSLAGGAAVPLVTAAAPREHNAFNYTVAHCSVPGGFPPSFPNPCCYPVMPVCPLNCMPSACAVPSRSCTCRACANNATETLCQVCSKARKDSTNEFDKNNETDELIKEIYKFVTLNPNSARRRSRDNLIRKEGGGKLTSRSVGGNSRVSRHDANVGTSKMKCYSKSCEAIGSRMTTETSYTTQSDTVLEKLSLDVSRSDTELSTDVTVREKTKKNKFASALRSIGLFKKKKAVVTDTESSLEVDVRPKNTYHSPFRQDIVDYAMYAQEYYQRPPSPPVMRPDRYEFVPPPPGCEHRGPYYQPPPPPPPPPPFAPHVPQAPHAPHAPHAPSAPGTYTPHRVHGQTIPEDSAHYHVPRHCAPPYPDPYEHRSYHERPQVPLCLKEIEVKSTGTQSERKISFLRKLGRRTPPGLSSSGRSDPAAAPRSTEGTQTFQARRGAQQDPNNPLITGWKKFQDKVTKDLNEDPLMYGYRTKQQLLENDKKMKSAMLKKMFYKRNPFSPNNLIIRTLLGNDPSSFGEPNMTMRPKLFF